MKALRGKPEIEGKLLAEAFSRVMSFKILEQDKCKKRDPEARRVRRGRRPILEEIRS